MPKEVRPSRTYRGCTIYHRYGSLSSLPWTAYVEDRVPMEEIAAFLGHRDINVTIRVYARYHPDYLRKASRSLTW